MVGTALKKLANENGMKISNGVAYGSFHGYATTLSEGNGYKRITITTHFTDVDLKNALLAKINGKDLSKEFRVRNLEFFIDGIDIVFLDNPGTMKKIDAFIEWFFPLLTEHSATGVQHCTQCDCEITDSGNWQLINGVAYHYHTGCVSKVKNEIEAEYEQQVQEDTGSYITGFFGAFFGGLIGAIAWAIVLNFGYVASIVGLLIGWLAEKGYNLFGGKKGKGKIVILIAVAVVGVAVGTVGAQVIEMVKLIANGEMPGLLYSDIPLWLKECFKDAEYLRYILADFVLGLLFACLGCFSFLRNKGKEVSKIKVIDLE